MNNDSISILINKSNSEAMFLVNQAIKRAKESERILTGLMSIELDHSETFQVLVQNEDNKKSEHHGYVLGILKAIYDTLPDDLASKMNVNGVPLDALIKLKVDENVLKRRKKLKNIQEINLETDYWSNYRRLSETICGFGYSMSFATDRFQMFYPGKMSHFVSGFGKGYNDGFHTIAAESEIETIRTNPVTQDIWKNWEYFLKHDCFEYRIDGKFLFMYHGGLNLSGDSSIPANNNVLIVNKGVYEQLKSRKIEQFTEMNFNFVL